jgi:hypothetical protein
MIVIPARQVWLFSRLVCEGYGGKECRDAAELGYHNGRAMMECLKILKELKRK